MRACAIVGLFAVVALAAAVNPPRPNIPGTFVAQVNVQIGGHREELNGQGVIAYDPANNRAVEDFELRRPLRVLPWHVFQLQRYDQGEVFEIDSDDKNECRMRVVQGNLPGAWDWVNQATYIGKDYFKNIQIDLWAFQTQGIELEVGVREPNYNVPIFTRQRTQGQETTNEFTSFSANKTVDSKYFDIPRECQNAAPQKALPAPPTPQRPVISEDFFAQMAVEVHQRGEHIFGEGVLGFDHDVDKSVNNVQLHRQGSLRPLIVFQLQRYDLGEVFEIDSEDKNECRMRVVTGSLPPAWDWVQKAQYIGQDLFKNLIVDLWAASYGGNMIEVGVSSQNVNRPIFVRQRSNGNEVVNEFQRFDANVTIDSKYFDIPRECQGQKVEVPLVKLAAGPAPPTPSRPVIPENFFSQIRVEDHSHDQALFGEGIMAWDFTQNKSVSQYELHRPLHIFPLTVLQLQRFDLGEVFEIDSDDKNECRMRVVQGSLPSAFDWVAQAQYVGKDYFHNVQIDLWRASFGHVDLELGVQEPYTNRPLILRQRFQGGEVVTEFYNFDANPTFPSNAFDVPRECQGSA